MIDSEPASSSEPNPTSAGVPKAEPGDASTASSAFTSVRLVPLAVGAGLLAAVASWLVGERVLHVFVPPYVAQHVMGQTIMKASFEDQAIADTNNATLAFAVLGGMLGASLGMAGGLARRSTKAGVGASLIGLVLGVGLGAGASRGLLPFYFQALDKAQEDLSKDLALPLLVHGGIWAACGLAGGLAFAVGLGAWGTRLPKSAVGGLVGALLGAALYELIAATAFPHDKTTSPLPTIWTARLIAWLLVAILSGLLAAVAISTAARHPAKLARTP